MIPHKMRLKSFRSDWKTSQNSGLYSQSCRRFNRAVVFCLLLSMGSLFRSFGNLWHRMRRDDSERQ